MKNAIYFLLIALAAFGAYYGFRAVTAPKYDEIVTTTIDPSQDPEQTEATDPTPLKLEFRDGEADMTPKARYKIAAKVCGRQRYRDGWVADVAPYDLCLSWGRLAIDDLKDKVKFSQDMRWYQYRVHTSSPFDIAYVAQHSANTHILYADGKLLRAVSRLSKGDIIEMTGYLVFISGKYKGREIKWESSLRRDDTGRGACEVFYITSLQKGDKLYGKVEK